MTWTECHYSPIARQSLANRSPIARWSFVARWPRLQVSSFVIKSLSLFDYGITMSCKEKVDISFYRLKPLFIVIQFEQKEAIALYGLFQCIAIHNPYHS